MLHELTESYVPEQLLHREKQLEIIGRTFLTFKEYGTGANLIVQGCSGSGKTTAVHHLLKAYQGHYSYVSGAYSRTAFKLLRALLNTTASTLESALNMAIQHFKQNPKILIIDEINKLRDNTEIKTLFNALNTLYRETNCPIILITNIRSLLGLMPDDAKLTLLFERVEFHSYNAVELYDIISQRVVRLNPLHAQRVSEECLRYICAVTTRNFDGSVRSALRLVQRCLISNVFTQTFIDDSLKVLLQEDWYNELQGLSQSHKRFLEALLTLGDIEGSNISFASIIKSFPEYSPGRISQLITFFEDFGLLKSEHKNLGRSGGNRRTISFISEAYLEKVRTVMETYS